MLKIDGDDQGLESAANTGISGTAFRTLVMVGSWASENELGVNIGDPSGGNRWFAIHYFNGWASRFTTGASTHDVGSPPGYNVPAVFVMRNNALGDGNPLRWQGFRDGAGSVIGDATGMDTADTPLHLGYRINGTSANKRGHLGEVMLFDRALTEPERKFLEDYLTFKWKGTGQPPPDSVPAQLVWTGTPPVTVEVAEDTSFDGTVAGAGPWVKTGAGTLLLTAASTSTGPLVISQGAVGAAASAVATEGPVFVQDGATLFGQGRAGGSVDVMDGGWIQGGLPATCGTLTTGGGLTLWDGANVKVRYAAGSHPDAFAVGGTLTLPDSGVITAEVLGLGARLPNGHLLFDTQLPIAGPAGLAGWTVAGVTPVPKVRYSANRTKVYLGFPGTLILIK